MEAGAIRKFVDFFQQFLELTENENWPVESTTEQEIRNTYAIAMHIEKCVDRFQRRGALDDFIYSILTSATWDSRKYLRDCLTKPSETVLKKIINSQTSIKQVEVGVNLYLEIYSARKLRITLGRLFMETASKETLLSNLSTEFTAVQLIKFKSTLLLSEMNTSDKPEEIVNELLNDTNQECVEVLVASLQNCLLTYDNSVHKHIRNGLERIMLCKKQTNKDFWKYFFNVKDKYLCNVGLLHPDLFELACTALFDVGKLLKEQMSTEFFYIDMTYFELEDTVKIICGHPLIKLKFCDYVIECSDDPEFWEQMIKNASS